MAKDDSRLYSKTDINSIFKSNIQQKCGGELRILSFFSQCFLCFVFLSLFLKILSSKINAHAPIESHSKKSNSTLVSRKKKATSSADDGCASRRMEGTFYRVFFFVDFCKRPRCAQQCRRRLISHVILNFESGILSCVKRSVFAFSSSLLMTERPRKTKQTKTRRDEEKECVAFFCALCRWFSSVASSSSECISEIVLYFLLLSGFSSCLCLKKSRAGGGGSFSSEQKKKRVKM